MAPSTVQAPASAAPAVATHAPPPSPVAFVQEISTSLIAEVSASAALVGPVMALRMITTQKNMTSLGR